jgi:hypothetical protein
MHLQIAGFSPMLLILIITVVSVVMIFKLMHLAILFLVHPHAIGAVAGLGAIVFFVLLAISAANHGGMQAVINNFQPQKQMNANAQRAAAEERNLRVKFQPGFPFSESQTLASTEKPRSTDKAIDKATDKTTGSASNGPPAWINQPPHREGDSYFVVVKLDADISLGERDEWLDQRMLVAARDYIDERLFPGEDVSKIVKVSAKNLYDNCLREIYPASGLTEAGKEVYARLEFDRRFREEIEGQYRETLEDERIRRLAGIALGGMVVLGGLYTYLKMTPNGWRAADKQAVAAGKLPKAENAGSVSTAT